MVRSQGAEKLDKSNFTTSYLRASGGIFVDTAVHDIDLTLSFLGEDVRPIELWAKELIALHHDLMDVGDVGNDNGAVKFWNGKIVHYYHPRTTAHEYDNCAEIIGSKTKVLINWVQFSNEAGIVQDATSSWIDQYSEAFVTELEEFTGAILEGRVAVEVGVGVYGVEYRPVAAREFEDREED